MSYELPEFDKLREMAENSPEQLEELRRKLCDRLIQDAPERYRRKLRGLQFRVDMERRRAKSPMAACIAISGMMHDSFDRLRQTLNEATGQANPLYTSSTARSEAAAEEAKVLPFRRA